MSNPICTIITWYGSPFSCPLPYLWCNGADLAKIQNPPLYGYLLAANPKLWVSPELIHLPDLRGRFLRGLDLAGGQEPDKPVDRGRSIGSPQDHAFAEHRHPIPEIGTDRVPFIRDFPPKDPQSFLLNGRTSNRFTASAGVAPDKDRPSDFVAETRPTNTCVSFLIKKEVNGEERPLGKVLEKYIEGTKDHAFEPYPDHVYGELLELAKELDKTRTIE